MFSINKITPRWQQSVGIDFSAVGVKRQHHGQQQHQRQWAGHRDDIKHATHESRVVDLNKV